MSEFDRERERELIAKIEAIKRAAHKRAEPFVAELMEIRNRSLPKIFIGPDGIIFQYTER